MTMNKIAVLKAYAKDNAKNGMAYYANDFSDGEWKAFLGDNNHCVKSAKADMREMAVMQLSKRFNSAGAVRLERQR